MWNRQHLQVARGRHVSPGGVQLPVSCETFISDLSWPLNWLHGRLLATSSAGASRLMLAFLISLLLSDSLLSHDLTSSSDRIAAVKMHMWFQNECYQQVSSLFCRSGLEWTNLLPPGFGGNGMKYFMREEWMAWAGALPDLFLFLGETSFYRISKCTWSGPWAPSYLLFPILLCGCSRHRK